MLSFDDYKELKLRAARLPLDEVIKEPDCDFNCPKWLPFGCGCKNCHINNGYYRSNEMKERNFTKEEIKMIDNLLSRQNGCLGKTGCELLRRLRSEQCLRTRCNPLSKVAGNWS